jgi:hypothetical protein
MKTDPVSILAWIESDTLPGTRSELFAAALTELVFERTGPKIKPAIETAIAIHRGEFTPDAVSIRHRAPVQAPPAARRNGRAPERQAVRLRTI